MIRKILSNQSGKVSTVGSLISKFGSAFFAFLASVMLARFMSPNELGTYVFAFSIATLLSVPATLGMPMMISRHVSKYRVHNDYDKINGLFKRSNQLVGLLFIIILMLSFLSYILWWKSYDNELTTTIWISYILLFIISFGAIRSAALNGMKYVILGEIPDTFLRNLLFCGFLAILYFSGFECTPTIAMWMQVLAALTGFILGHIIMYVKVLKPLHKHGYSYETKYWIREAVPFTINAGMRIIRQRVSTILLATFSGMSLVAVYDIALKGATLVSFTLEAINKGIAPYISSNYELNNHDKLQDIVTKASQLVFVFSLPVALIFMIGGERAINLIFGEGYEDSYVPLFILCIGQLVTAFVGSVVLLVMMTGNQNYLAKINVWITVIGSLLTIPLVFKLGAVGAAIASALMLTVQSILLFNFALKKLKINTTIIKNQWIK